MKNFKILERQYHDVIINHEPPFLVGAKIEFLDEVPEGFKQQQWVMAQVIDDLKKEGWKEVD